VQARRGVRARRTGIHVRFQRIAPAKTSMAAKVSTIDNARPVPVFLAMIDWSARHDGETEAPADFLAAYRANPGPMQRTLNASWLTRRCQSRARPLC